MNLDSGTRSELGSRHQGTNRMAVNVAADNFIGRQRNKTPIISGPISSPLRSRNIRSTYELKNVSALLGATVDWTTKERVAKRTDDECTRSQGQPGILTNLALKRNGTKQATVF
ncbi:hypothetical protein MBANPS3_012359 [Mucor bainieri]